MDVAFTSVLSWITSTWTWLGSWNYHGVSFASYLIGLALLSGLIKYIFGR